MVEPITWVPSAALSIPAATAAAEPLLDPPGVRRKSCGLWVPRGSVAANSVVTVLPTMTAPASRSAATLAPSRSERQPANSGEPFSVGMSAVSNDVLDAERHAVDRREGPALAPAHGRLVGDGARALEIEMHEGADLGLERGEIGKTALEEIAGRIGTARKARRRSEVRLHRELELVFWGQHGDVLRTLGSVISCSHRSMDLVEQTVGSRMVQAGDHGLDRTRPRRTDRCSVLQSENEEVWHGALRTRMVVRSVRVIPPKRAHVPDLRLHLLS